MGTLKRRRKTIVGTLALAVVAVLMSASSASAVTFPNVCLNTASTDPNTAATQLPVEMTANAPASVAPGDPVTLSNIDQTLTVPATIFVTGYNLGLVLPGQTLQPGVPTEAVINATAQTDIEATNTVEGLKTTNLASGSVTTTITDGDGVRATGDESGTPGVLAVSYADLNWTAGGSAGTIDFREDTVQPINAGTQAGALIAKAIIFPGILEVTFACSPATVSPNPGPAANIAYDDPAVAFASTEIAAGNTAPIADAGDDQTVDSEQAGVSLDGSGSTDPDGDPITYSWTQTSGPAVSLSGADTATPSFDAPVGPATLEFELTVDDGEASDTDTVVVNVDAAPNTAPIADAGDDQTVDSEQAGVSLDGSGSTDPDGDPITYSWTQTSGPAVSLSGADTATPSFDAPVGPATLEFELTVDDGEASDTDTVVVNVDAAPNTAPVADAGPDQTVDSEQAGVSLDGSGSTDPDGDPITYSWTQTSGPAVSLSGADTATPSFDAPVGPATLEFELTVDDGEASDTDTVVVNVDAAPNTAPVADAGPDQTVDSEQAGVSLDGSGSTDPDGDPITYSWTQTSGPAVSLSGADTATPSFDAPVGPATLEFELTVDDGEASDTDTVVVNVDAAPNTAPIADAGDDQTVDSEQAGVSLDGSGSTDPDGDPITYSWTQTSGPAVSLSGADTATPSFDAPVGPATLEFELTVDDGEASDTDTVVVNVDAAPNTAPVADAGPDQTVDSEQAGVSLDGSGSTDPDGDPITYSWTQTSGPAVSLSGADTATPSFDAPVGPATLEFELTVDDGEASDTDTVVVNVDAAPNTAPVADAGPDQTVDSEQAGVSLDGSGSTDPDGDPITYSWTQTSGPAVSLSGADTATPSFDAPVGPATLEFELTVDDGEASDTDTVVVNVDAAPNTAPVADAGARPDGRLRAGGREPRRERLDRSRRRPDHLQLDPDLWARSEPERRGHRDAELRRAGRTGDARVRADRR